MKKIILGILLSTMISSCAILNPIGLTSGRISGSEAADKIINAAILQDLINSSAIYGRVYISIFSLIADSLAGINPTGYYLESEVDDCVSEINGATGFLFGSTLTILIQSKCSLEEDKSIMDSPLPEL